MGVVGVLLTVDRFTICMKLVPLSRGWRQLRPLAFGPVQGVVRNRLWMEATTTASLRACSRDDLSQDLTVGAEFFTPGGRIRLACLDS